MFCGPDGNIISLYFTLPENTMFTEHELVKMYLAVQLKFVPRITSRYNLHRELNNIYLNYIVDFSDGTATERR